MLASFIMKGMHCPFLDFIVPPEAVACQQVALEICQLSVACAQ